MGGEHGRFVPAPRNWEQLLEYKLVEKWFKRLAGSGIKDEYLAALNQFSAQAGLTPEQFITLSPKKARDVAWGVTESLLNKGFAYSAKRLIVAMRHFYRFSTEQKLKFDSRKGDKHFIATRRKRVAYEIIPDRKQVYIMVDSVGNWRDKAMLLVLFQSGMHIDAGCLFTLPPQGFSEGVERQPDGWGCPRGNHGP